MATTTIQIEVDEETARQYAALSPEEKRRFTLLLGADLIRRAQRSKRSLTEVMDEIGASATANGMTPEILESILNER